MSHADPDDDRPEELVGGMTAGELVARNRAYRAANPTLDERLADPDLPRDSEERRALESQSDAQMMRITEGLAAVREMKRELQAELARLIADVERWQEMDRGERARHPGQIYAAYLARPVHRINELVPEILAVYEQIEMMPRSVYSDLRRMLEDVEATRWPEGLTARRLDELRYHARCIGGEIGRPTEPTTAGQGSPPAESMPEAQIQGDATNDRPAFILGPLGGRPIIGGREVGKLTKARHAVIKALWEAGPKGLDFEKLNRIADVDRADKILSRLMKSHPEWMEVYEPPGESHTGYRLKPHVFPAES